MRGQVSRRIMLKLLQKDAMPVDLAERLAVGGARDPEPDRQRGAVARQADDAHVMAEIFAAELRADAGDLSQRRDLGLHREVAEGVAVLAALRRQIVEIMRRGELHGLEIELGRRAADDDRKMIGRAGRCPERQDFLAQELDQAIMRQKRGRALEEIGLVGRTAALGDEQEFVSVLALGVDVDLRGKIGFCIHLLEHAERRELRIAQIVSLIGVADALGDGAGVVARGEDQPAFLAHDDRAIRTRNG